ncbi:Alpha/Beta hydrolase protein [Podospora conica]|nr:Alpha/Beta hydrolase protein [Schizothecium conicum]
MSTTTHSTITVDDGISIFYRTSGSPSSPTILLLHGFPSSSHMFRHLIPLLATRYRVIAPDLPGFGFTTVPASRAYPYTFSSLATTLSAFVSALHLTTPFALYIFDYGAPVGLRFALDHPGSVGAIVSQNGNAYAEGLAPGFWGGLQKWWASGKDEDGDAVRFVLEMPMTRWQYENGAPDPGRIPPEAYHLDQALMEREGNKEVQMALFWDYRTNVDMYGRFQAYLRESGVPVLTAWGKGDECFIPPGAEAFKRDVKKLETRWLDAGHFALETNEAQMAEWMLEFFDKYEVFK